LACGHGHLEVAKWLHSTFGLTAGDARERNNEALREACWGGHLVVAEWLRSTFGLTTDDARTYHNVALRCACRSGRLEVAKWLRRAFGLTAEDARVRDNEALRWACACGHLEVAKWLQSTFGLTADDARAQNNDALHLACSNGHLEVAEWLRSTFGLLYPPLGSRGMAPRYAGGSSIYYRSIYYRYRGLLVAPPRIQTKKYKVTTLFYPLIPACAGVIRRRGTKVFRPYWIAFSDPDKNPPRAEKINRGARRGLLSEDARTSRASRSPAGEGGSPGLPGAIQATASGQEAGRRGCAGVERTRRGARCLAHPAER